MIKNIFRVLTSLTVLILLAPSDANAQTSRLYFAGYLGLNTFNDQKFTESSTANSGDLEMGNGTSYAGALGLRLSHNLRAEAELSYRSSDFTAVDISGSGSFSTGGEMKSTFAFLNLYYDFDVPWKVQPFVGGGLGYGWHSGEVVDGSGVLINSSAETSDIAWNLGGGIKYRPRTDVAFTGSYRYVDSLNLDVSTYEIDYGSHEFRIGMEWDFPMR